MNLPDSDRQAIRRIFQRAQKLLRMSEKQDHWSKFCCDCIAKASKKDRQMSDKAEAYFDYLFRPMHRDGRIGWWEDQNWDSQNARLMALRLAELTLAP